MKRILILVLMVLVTAMVFAGGSGESKAKAGDAGYVIKFSHPDPPDVFKSSAHAEAVMFKQYVEDRTGGKVVVEIYPANELVSEREALEGVKLGSIQMSNVSEG